MPRGIAELKKRNSSSREIYHIRRRNRVTCRKLQAEDAAIKSIWRETATTGELKKLNRSDFNREIAGEFPRAISLNRRLALYASPERVVWEQLDAGAVYFGMNGIYWIEKLIVAH